MANQQKPASDETPPAAGANQPPPRAPQPSTPIAPTEEQRIAERRVADLMRQASDAAAETQTARADAAGLRGENERLAAELAGLRVINERLANENRALLESSAARDNLPNLPDLPKGAFQLVESVTIATVGPDGKPVRANPKRGDVVFVMQGKDAAEDLEDLQKECGVTSRVFPVTRETLEELRTLKHVR